VTGGSVKFRTASVEIMPKALANVSPGLERQRKPWVPDN
jgi:hypothetical protein